MIDLQRAQVNTAGAYVCINGLHPFAIGARPHNGMTPVVRLGGHREGDETGWQCAVREVFEETTLQIKPKIPPKTYLLPNGDSGDLEVEDIPWQVANEQEPAPFLIVAYPRENQTLLSLMYMVQATGVPIPSAEVRGLLLLNETEIHRLCHEAITLKEYLRCGGTALLNHSFDEDLILEPFLQLRLLSKILKLQSKDTVPPSAY